MKTRYFKSKLLATAYHSAKAMYEVGAIKKNKFRDYEESCCFPEIDFTPKQIKRIRQQNKLNEYIFAQYLNTNESTVKAWESGTRKPGRLALRLLWVVQKHGIHILE